MENNATPPETMTITEDEPFNMYLPSESFHSIELTCDAGATAKVVYFQ